MSLIRDINEANLSAKELNKDVYFETYLMTWMPDSHKTIGLENFTDTLVKVNNLEFGEQYFWDIEKFNDRLSMIWELANQYFETSVIPKMSGFDDPFFD